MKTRYRIITKNIEGDLRYVVQQKRSLPWYSDVGNIAGYQNRQRTLDSAKEYLRLYKESLLPNNRPGTVVYEEEN